MVTAAQILTVLDQAAREYHFADPEHPYYSAIDARLHLFRDDQRWAMVIELVGYNPRAGDVIDVVHRYGNCLAYGKQGYENEDFFGRIDNMDEIYSPGIEPLTFTVDGFRFGAAVCMAARMLTITPAK